MGLIVLLCQVIIKAELCFGYFLVENKNQKGHEIQYDGWGIKLKLCLLLIVSYLLTSLEIKATIIDGHQHDTFID